LAKGQYRSYQGEFLLFHLAEATGLASEESIAGLLEVTKSRFSKWMHGTVVPQPMYVTRAATEIHPHLKADIELKTYQRSFRTAFDYFVRRQQGSLHPAEKIPNLAAEYLVQIGQLDLRHYTQDQDGFWHEIGFPSPQEILTTLGLANGEILVEEEFTPSLGIKFEQAGVAAPLYHIDVPGQVGLSNNSVRGHALVLLRADRFSMSRSNFTDTDARNGFYVSVQTHDDAARQISQKNAHIKAPGLSKIGSVFRNGTGLSTGRHGSLTLYLDDEVVDKQPFMVDGIRETEMYWNVVGRDRLKPIGEHRYGATFGRIEDIDGLEYLTPGRVLFLTFIDDLWFPPQPEGSRRFQPSFFVERKNVDHVIALVL
jgi:hypothetical protein